MKNILLISRFLLAFLLLFIVALEVQATVGGPTYVYDLNYNPQDQSVYYIKNSQSGRGCPPELMKVSLVSGVTTSAFSCDDGEELLRSSGTYDYSIVEQKIESIVSNFKDLTPINLPKNLISIDIDFLRSELVEPGTDWVLKSHFIAKVYQDNKKIAEFPVGGCSKDQPFIFAGYAIPVFDKKIALMLSAKGDCWEGGYTMETVNVVGNISHLDKTGVNNFYKTSAPLLPSEATLVIFEKDKVVEVVADENTEEDEETEVIEDELEIDDDTEEDDSVATILIVIVGFVILGVIFGTVIFKINKNK